VDRSVASGSVSSEPEDNDQTLDTERDDLDEAVAHFAGRAGDGEPVDERIVALPGDERASLAMMVGAVAGDGVHHPVSGHLPEFCRGVGSGREASERGHASPDEIASAAARGVDSDVHLIGRSCPGARSRRRGAG
jgi:hypothetical protein